MLQDGALSFTVSKRLQLQKAARKPAIISVADGKGDADYSFVTDIALQ